MVQRIRDTATATVEYTDAEREFMVALDRYKRKHQRPYPTCQEVLAVLTSLGYRQVAAKEALPTFYRAPNGLHTVKKTP